MNRATSDLGAMRRSSYFFEEKVDTGKIVEDDEDGQQIARTLSLLTPSMYEGDGFHKMRSAFEQGRLSFVRSDIRAMVRTESGRRRMSTNLEDEIVRTDTCGNISTGGSLRDLLKGQAKATDSPAVAIDDGQTGAVFALEAGGQKIAVFKPRSGERFERSGIHAGDGAVREEAVYIVDRLSGGHAGVPVTSRAEITLDSGEPVQGALQAFHLNAVGFADDFGRPSDLQKARDILTQESLEALALLDMRVFNMDRHGGNLLFIGDKSPYSLGPIDHGCCLPPWWSLREGVFDAWLDWPQLECQPSQLAMEIAQKAYTQLDRICERMRALQLDDASIITLQACTVFAFVGVHEIGVPVGRLARLMIREYDPSKMSWFEEKVLRCSSKAGASVRVVHDSRGDEMLDVDEDASSGFQPDLFLTSLEELCRAELPKQLHTTAEEINYVRQRTPEAVWDESDGSGDDSPLKRSDPPVGSLSSIER
jgi:hypothetical protein